VLQLIMREIVVQQVLTLQIIMEEAIVLQLVMRGDRSTTRYYTSSYWKRLGYYQLLWERL
jgi:hypothetical protein